MGFFKKKKDPYEPASSFEEEEQYYRGNVEDDEFEDDTDDDTLVDDDEVIEDEDVILEDEDVIEDDDDYIQEDDDEYDERTKHLPHIDDYEEEDIVYEEEDDGVRYEEGEYEDGDDEDYYEEDEPKKFPTKLVIIFGILGVAGYFLGLTFGLWGDNTELNKTKAKDVIVKMYANKNADNIINKNDSILSYFTGGAKSYVDLRDSDNFERRYPEFKNKPTYVTIDNVFTFEDSVVSVYTVTNNVDLPSKRLSIMEFDDDGLIHKFKEYRIYDINEN